MKHCKIIISILAITLCIPFVPAQVSAQNSPRIAHIINFLRQTEPRYDDITDEILYETVAKEIHLLKKHQLKGTFLIQYDALINPKYQKLLKTQPYPGTEIGAWWEITQPHVEAAGLQWRGRYPWDWHAHVGFATGYTPREREILVDTYMAKFKEIFGAYPTSVGSWFIDAHTLSYMYEKYHITASCTCKDQIGTDGYTMWGGYWNQAYYPSKKNAYMPAQTTGGQIPVPIFRMLGSDPIYQYDCGLGGTNQPVISLEPVYEHAGGSPRWVDWFFETIFAEPSLAFSYTQAGQENSFTWKNIQKGLEYQIQQLALLKKTKGLRIETLTESGQWFKNNFPLTPSTAVTALTDYTDNDKKTVWYNSRFYRANLLWEGNKLRVRDIHLFNENYPSQYLDRAGTSTQCIYTTLPFIDGFQWSNKDILAGLRFISHSEQGATEIEGENPVITENQHNLMVQWPLKNTTGAYQIAFSGNQIDIFLENTTKNNPWELELSTSPQANLPFTTISDKKVNALLNGFTYEINCLQGEFVDCRQTHTETVLKIKPQEDRITLTF